MKKAIKIGIFVFCIISAASACAQEVKKTETQSVLPKNGKKIPVEIPITNQIYIKARLNNSEPMWFLLDTGATWTILDMDKAKDLNIKTDNDTTLDLGQTNTVKTAFAKNATLDVSGVSVAVETLAVMPVKFRQAPQIVGIIGSEMFKKFTVEIDYAAKAVSLFKPESYQYKGKGERLPMTVIEEIPRVKFDFSKDGKSLSANLLIDTGASQTVVFYAPFVEKNKLLESTEGMLKIRAGGLGGGGIVVKGRLKTFNIGKITFDNPLINFAQNRGAADRRDGVIGNGIFNRFKLIVDYSRLTVIFEPTKKLNVPTDFDFFGFEIVSAENGFRVNDVYPSSPAGEAGLKANDIILTIDGKSLSKLSLVEVSRMFMLDGRERELQIKRGTETIQVKLKTYKVDFLQR